MKRVYFEKAMKQAQQKAQTMFSFVVASCPDSHLNDWMLHVRNIAKSKHFDFDQIVCDGDFASNGTKGTVTTACFFKNGTPVAVITETDKRFEIYHDYQGKPSQTLSA